MLHHPSVMERIFRFISLTKLNALLILIEEGILISLGLLPIDISIGKSDGQEVDVIDIINAFGTMTPGSL